MLWYLNDEAELKNTKTPWMICITYQLNKELSKFTALLLKDSHSGIYIKQLFNTCGKTVLLYVITNS